MLRAYLLEIEKGHQGTGAHPQQNLHPDQERQPLVELAAKDMQAQFERPRSQLSCRSVAGQGRRGAREEEWYCTIFQPDSSCERTEVATPSRSITRPSSSSIR